MTAGRWPPCADDVIIERIVWNYEGNRYRYRQGEGGHNINTLDITQTVLQDYFTMVMLVDTAACAESIGDMSDILDRAGKEQGLSIRIQREDIFNAMHRI